MVRFGHQIEIEGDEGEEPEIDDLSNTSNLDSNDAALSSVICYNYINNPDAQHLDIKTEKVNECALNSNIEIFRTEENSGIGSTTTWDNGLRRRVLNQNSNSSFYTRHVENGHGSHCIHENVYNENENTHVASLRHHRDHRRHHQYAYVYNDPRSSSIHRPHDYTFEDEVPQTSSSSWMWKLVIIFVLFFSFRHYDELSFPARSISIFIQQLCSEIYFLAKEDSFLFFNHLRHTYQHFVTNKKDSQNDLVQDPCIMRVPSVLPKSLQDSISSEFLSEENLLSATETWLLSGIVGQNKPIEWIAKALDGWILHDENLHIDRNVERTCQMEMENIHENHFDTDLKSGCAEIKNVVSTKQSIAPVRPLSMLFTGPDGVGKSETAYLISKLLFSSCQTESQSVFTKHDSILILHGEDFISGPSTPEDNQINNHPLDLEYQKQDPLSFPENARERLRNTIISHVHSHSQNTLGAIIIFTGIEQVIDVSTLDVFSDILNQPDSATLSSPSSSLNVSFERLLLIFTTDLGTDKLFRLLQKYDGNTDEVPKLQINSAIKSSIDQYWDGRLKLIKHLDAIVPFMPLRHSDLVEIMRRKVHTLSKQYAHQNWKSLVVTEPALRYIVGTDFVDYLDLRPTGNRDNNSFLIFSKYGAHTLENGGPMHVIRVNIRRYLQPLRKDEVALLDFDKRTKLGILGWCKEGENETKAITQFNARTCEEIWRGPLE